MSRLPRATELAHQLVSARLSPGDSAIDATAGNGHDTRFLAEQVGPNGVVLTVDLQENAIESTRRHCADVDCQIEYHVADHATLTGEPGSAQAIMFNLGYLPSGDKTVITRADTTVAALQAALGLLAPGGILTIAIYTGHPGGEEESIALEDFVSGLEQSDFGVARYQFLNQRNTPPHLIAVEKRR